MEKDDLNLFFAIDEQIADGDYEQGVIKDALSLVPEIDEEVVAVEDEAGVPTDAIYLLPEIDEQIGHVEHEEVVTKHLNADDFEKTLLSKGNELAGSLCGMKASKWEDMFSMYKSHSQHIGFSVIKATSRRSQGVGTAFIERYFRCSCAGVHGNGRVRSLTDGPEVVRSLTRNASVSKTNCQASLRTQVNGDGLWEVVEHIVEHNHPLTPVQWQHHHRSERKISEAEGEIIQAMSETHVRPSVQFTVAAAVAGGEAFVGHTKRDHINYVNRLKMRAIEGGDAATLINLLTSRQAEEPGFFFRVQFDEKGRLSNLFWRDAMMREDYLLYRDVKIFDTTYRTNRYNLICGAFVGINNHWSNVMFGCAFLSNEREESFVWLFNVFNESMGEDLRPVSIFTDQDQDQAIANAIEQVYPSTRHRLCQWHIQQNAISQFGKLKGDRPFQNLFNKCLNGCYTEEEFEETWRKMLSTYGLENHAWFKRLYKYRAKWSTALNNEYFSAGLLLSQRSESTNHAMGFQASKTTSVTEFFGIFEATVKRWRAEEERKEFNGIRCKPTSVYPLVDLLLHASQVYTLELFRIFEKEFALAIGSRATIVPVDDTVLLYRVQSPAVEDAAHHVTYDCANTLLECTCRKFQVMGMLFSHTIRVLHMHSVAEIPDRYIVRWWTKFAKTNVWERLLPSDIRRTQANDAINWRRSMLTATNHLITKSQNVVDARLLVEKLFLKAMEEVQILLSNVNMDSNPPNVEDTGPPILDPIRCTTKGRSQRKKRKMGPKKKAKKGTDLQPGGSAMYTPVPRLI